MGLQAGAYSLQADGGTAAAAEPEVCCRKCQRRAAGRASGIGQAGTALCAVVACIIVHWILGALLGIVLTLPMVVLNVTVTEHDLTVTHTHTHTYTETDRERLTIMSSCPVSTVFTTDTCADNRTPLMQLGGHTIELIHYFLQWQRKHTASLYTVKLRTEAPCFYQYKLP